MVQLEGSMAWPMNVDVDPSVLLTLPDSRLFRVNGVRDVVSDVNKQLSYR